jgi:hypothetical protein
MTQTKVTDAMRDTTSLDVSDLSGAVPVAKGGTGATTHTANNVLVGNGTSAIASVAPSTSGNVLTSNGSAWASTAPGGGKVLQVVSTGKTDTFSNASTTFTDITGMSVSITPSATSSRILVLCQISWHNGAISNRGFIRLMRDSTPINVATSTGNRPATSIGGENDSGSHIMSGNIQFVDSPSSTSAIAYHLEASSESGSTFYLNRTIGDADNAVTPRATSTITAIEIGA